jgi:hypothetical protein
MYTSGVRVLPDTSQLNQSADRLGQMKIALLQQDLADKQQQVAEFKTIVDNSYHNVWDQDREEYTRLQDDFLKKASDIYKKKDGRPTMADYQQIKKEEKNLEHFVASHNQLRAMASDVVAKAQFNDKIDFKPSLKQFNDIMEGEGSPHEKLAAIQSGGWIVPAKVEVDFDKKAANLKKLLTKKTGGFESRSNVPGVGGGVITEGETIDLKQAEEAIRQEYRNTPKYHDDYTEEAYVNGYMLRLSPGWKRDKSVVKGQMSVGGGKKPLVIDPNERGSYNLQARDKTYTTTFDPGTPIYDFEGNQIKLENGIQGKIVGFQELDRGSGKKMYAQVTLDTTKDDALYYYREGISPDNNKVPNEKLKVVYYPIEELEPEWLEREKITLTGYNDGSRKKKGDDPFFGDDVDLDLDLK